jgi:hypothetical protein
MTIKLFRLLPLLTAGLLPSATRAQTSDTHVTGTTMSRGIHLTLAVPRNRYEMNALARVSITMTNVSRHPIVIRKLPIDCGGLNPSVAVQDVRGRYVVSPNQASFEFRACPDYGDYRVAPGSTLRVVRYVVIAGPRVVASVVTLPLPPTCEVDTPPAWVVLTPSVPLKLQVRHGSEGVFLQVARPIPSSNGPLRYIQSLKCTRSNGYILRAQNYWVAVPRRSISPACLPIREWRIIAGYLNYPWLPWITPPRQDDR